jgi:hypothetical protein
LDYIDATNETGILVGLDQEKAFDQVDRWFLERVLETFGFGINIRASQDEIIHFKFFH